MLNFTRVALNHYILSSDPLRFSAVSTIFVYFLCFSDSLGRIDFDDLFFSRRPYSSLESYRQSKLANVLFSRELARRLKGPRKHYTLEILRGPHKP